jgi:predicted dehydrogenase
MSHRGGPIGVGIVGLSAAGGWAASAHVPALAALDAFDLRGLAASTPQSAAAAGEKYGVPLRFSGAHELAQDEQIDLVVVAVKVPYHRDLVLAALDAGKIVYCEWPLGRDLAEAEEMAGVASSSNLPTIVGLQARSAPAFRYLRDLIADGYVGEVLSTSVIASGVNWGQTIRPGGEYMLSRENGATMLSVPLGHTVDALTMVLGEFERLTATMALRRTSTRHAQSGEVVATDADDQIAVSGTLAGGAVASIHFRGGLSRGTNFLWEINGTDGDLQVTLGAPPVIQFATVSLRGARNGQMESLPVPPEYVLVPAFSGREGEPGYNVAHGYELLARDLADGTHATPDFAHAVRRHRLLDRIERSAHANRVSSVER